MYEAITNGTPTYIPLSPYPEYQTPQSSTAEYSCATCYSSHITNQHLMPPPQTLKPSLQELLPSPRKKIFENIRNIDNQNVNRLTHA